jgi:RES domain-containing protein
VVTTCFRLHKSRYRADDGTGASLHSGRWNLKGQQAIYTAASVALAALEILVHAAEIPDSYIATSVRIPKGVKITTIALEDLPEGWDALESKAASQSVGSTWIKEQRSAVLSVPSTIVPMERNYVLNPQHPDFGRIEFGAAVPFRFDPRLK